MAVYIIGPCPPSGPGPYKIGYTNNDGKKRLAQLQTGSPIELQIIMWFPSGNRSLETRLHRFFAGKRTKGEWFDLSSEDFIFLSVCVDTDVLNNANFLTAMNVYVKQELASGNPQRQLNISALVLNWEGKI